MINNQKVIDDLRLKIDMAISRDSRLKRQHVKDNNRVEANYLKGRIDGLESVIVILDSLIREASI